MVLFHERAQSFVSHIFPLQLTFAGKSALVQILENKIAQYSRSPTRAAQANPYATNNPNLAIDSGVANPTSRILCSEKAQNTISAYLQGSGICGVPLEKREPARKIFEEFLDRPFLSRRHVLCNLGTRGTGKTVLQAFNMLWFVRSKPEGLAIEVTFNDDQGGGLWKGNRAISTDLDLQCAIALRILHRAVAKKCDDNRAKRIISKNQGLLLEQLSAEHEEQEPIEMALHVARHLAGVSETAPVLLAVDELVKAAHGGGRSTSTMMTDLGLLLDTKCFLKPPVYLAVTTYYSNDLASFATASNRPLLLQPLPPLLPAMPTGLSPQQVQALPPMLRALADEEIRKSLPSCEETVPRSVLGRVSQLLQAAGGHPRRVYALFAQLEKFNPSTPLPVGDHAPDRRWGEMFVSELDDWLTQGYSRSLQVMSECEAFDFSATVDLDGLAAATATPFNFPDNRTAAHQCLPFLTASEFGMCQFIAPDDHQPLRGFAYIPLPVLQLIKGHRPTGGASLNALNDLTDALTAFGSAGPSGPPHLAGKPFEDLIEASLVLYLRHNLTLTLSQLCGGSTHLLTTLVRGGPATNHLKGIKRFPLNPQPTTIPPADKPWDAFSLVQLITTFRRAGNAPLIFRPSDPLNVSGDIFCLLPRAGAGQSGALLVVVQCKAHFCRTKLDQKVTLKKWRKGRRFFTDSALTFTTTNEERPNPIPELLAANNITPVFLLFCTNPVDTAKANLGADEGVVDLVRMRSWLPTAAFAAECATVLRALFRTSVEEEEEEEEDDGCLLFTVGWVVAVAMVAGGEGATR